MIYYDPSHQEESKNKREKVKIVAGKEKTTKAPNKFFKKASIEESKIRDC